MTMKWETTTTVHKQAEKPAHTPLGITLSSLFFMHSEESPVHVSNNEHCQFFFLEELKNIYS